jgi:hypothetical protein
MRRPSYQSRSKRFIDLTEPDRVGRLMILAEEFEREGQIVAAKGIDGVIRHLQDEQDFTKEHGI